MLGFDIQLIRNDEGLPVTHANNRQLKQSESLLVRLIDALAYEELRLAEVKWMQEDVHGVHSARGYIVVVVYDVITCVREHHK